VFRGKKRESPQKATIKTKATHVTPSGGWWVVGLGWVGWAAGWAGKVGGTFPFIYSPTPYLLFEGIHILSLLLSVP